MQGIFLTNCGELTFLRKGNTLKTNDFAEGMICMRMKLFLKRAGLLLLALLLVLLLSGCAAVTDIGLELLDEALTESLSEGVEEIDVSADTETVTPSPKVTEKPTQEAMATPTAEPTEVPAPEETEEAFFLPEDGVYTAKEDVAWYLHTYGHLPDNFITKKEAESLGWPGGDLTPYAPGKCIGGNHFGNYEHLLPEKKGRTYSECDIDTLNKKSRGAKRLIYSNDGLIYYTEDHYETFELLYGEE